MRTIARGNTPEHCQKRVTELTRGGWKQISEIKLDPTRTINISFVCVLERKDDPVEKKKRNFGNFNLF